MKLERIFPGRNWFRNMTSNLLILHLTVGILFSVLGVYQLTKRWVIALLGAYVLFWGNLIYTATILSFFLQLGNPILYLVTSTSIFILTYVFLIKSKTKLIQKEIDYPKDSFLSFKNFSSAFFSSVFIFFGCIIFFYAINNYPSDGDFAGYKLTRVYHFIASGAMVPSTLIQGSDFFRTFNLPFNTALLHLLFIIYNAPDNSFGLLSFVSWILLILSIYSISRSLHISKLPALASSVMISISGVLLFQATIEGDDLVSSLPFVIGVYFFVLYSLHLNLFFLLIAGLGVGIGLGAKAFPMFYFPFIGILVIYYIRKEKYNFFKIFPWQYLAVTTFIALSVFVQHPIGKYFYSPEIKELAAKTQIPLNFYFNIPVNLHTGFFALVVNNSNLLFSPVTEYFPNVGSGYWLSLVKNVDSFFMENFWFEVARSEMLVPKPVLNNSEFYSNKEYFGTTGLLIFISLFYMYRGKKFKIHPIGIFGLAFIFWDISFSFTYKYVASGRYWILPITLCAPFIANALEQMKKSFIPIKIIIMVCLFSNILFAWANVTLDYHRSLISVFFNNEYKGLQFPYLFQDALSKNKNVNNLNTYWNFPNYDVLSKMPTPRHFVSEFSNPKALNNFLNFAIISKNNLKNEIYPNKLMIAVEVPEKFEGNFINIGNCIAGPVLVREEILGDYKDFKKRYLFFIPHSDSVNPDGTELYSFRTAFLEGKKIPDFEIRINYIYSDGLMSNFPFKKLAETYDLKLDNRAKKIIIELKKNNLITKKEYPIKGEPDGGIDK